MGFSGRMRAEPKMRRSMSGLVCLADAGNMTFVWEAFMEEVSFEMDVTLGRVLGDAERRGCSEDGSLGAGRTDRSALDLVRS